MARIKYYYDTETCKYERIKVRNLDHVLNILGLLSVSAIIGVVMLFAYSKYFDSPKEMALKKENAELKLYYDLMEDEMESMRNMLASLQERDDNIYRTIMEAEPIPGSIRRAGVGGADRYRDLLDKGLSQERLILDTHKEIDQVKKEMYIQTVSYDEIMMLAKNKATMIASIPAIQPISNKELRRLASGYGMRLHPIHKIRKMHWGIDFTAPRGTPIYATGDGRVIKVNYSLGGYGKQVEIDHGYGYVTKYAHMSSWDVRVGQRVKRGQKIGEVGNTGASTAPHLHYEVIKNGKKVNPVYYFYNDLDSGEYEKILELASRENQSLG